MATVASVTDLKPGTPLGRYRIVRELGRGAMGIVFLADDTKLKQRLCLKVLAPNLVESPEAMERFHREILLARRIAHRSVCRIHDLHEESGLHFLSMEYVDGVCLRELLAAGRARLSIARATKIVENVCAALSAAHDVNVIHRDLKPGNVMVCDKDEVSVLDFGIATAADLGSSLTQPGIALGTRDYIAPETWSGHPASAKSDQFAIGVILFRCLTGQRPFGARATSDGLVDAMKAGAPAPSALRGDVPPALDVVALRALRYAPSERFDDLKEMARALEAVRASLAQTDDDDVTDPLPSQREAGDGRGAREAETQSAAAAAAMSSSSAAESDTASTHVTLPGGVDARAARRQRRLIAAAAAALALAGVAAAGVVAVSRKEQGPGVAAADAGASASAVPLPASAASGANDVVDADDAIPDDAVDVEPAAPSSPAATLAERERKRFQDARAAVAAAMRDKSLIAGDDAELDRVRARARAAARAKRYADAAAAEGEARARVGAIVVDSAFVKRKLMRFNARVDASEGSAESARIEAVSTDVLGAMDGRPMDANRALTAAFAALQMKRGGGK